MRRTTTYSIGAVFITAVVATFFLSAWTQPGATPPHAEPKSVATQSHEIRVCGGIDAHLISVSTETEFDEAVPETIDIVPTQEVPTTARAAVRVLTVSALGPMLGSVDSSHVQTDFTCTAEGFAVTAIITRSVNSGGAVLQNI